MHARSLTRETRKSNEKKLKNSSHSRKQKKSVNGYFVSKFLYHHRSPSWFATQFFTSFSLTISLFISPALLPKSRIMVFKIVTLQEWIPQFAKVDRPNTKNLPRKKIVCSFVWVQDLCCENSKVTNRNWRFFGPRIVAIAESYIDTNASVFRKVPACSKIRRLKNPIVFMEKYEFEPTDGMKCLRWVGNTELIFKSSCNVSISKDVFYEYLISQNDLFGIRCKTILSYCFILMMI